MKTIIDKLPPEFASVGKNELALSMSQAILKFSFIYTSIWICNWTNHQFVILIILKWSNFNNLFFEINVNGTT